MKILHGTFWQPRNFNTSIIYATSTRFIYRDSAGHRCNLIRIVPESRCGTRKFSFTAPCQDTCQSKKSRLCVPHPGCYCPDGKVYDEKTKRCVYPDECPTDGEGGGGGAGAGGSFGFDWSISGSKLLNFILLRFMEYIWYVVGGEANGGGSGETGGEGGSSGGGGGGGDGEGNGKGFLHYICSFYQLRHSNDLRHYRH